MLATLCALLIEPRKDLPRREPAPGSEIGNAFVDSLQEPLFVVELIGERGPDEYARRDTRFPGNALQPSRQVLRNAYLVVHHRTAFIDCSLDCTPRKRQIKSLSTRPILLGHFSVEAAPEKRAPRLGRLLDRYAYAGSGRTAGGNKEATDSPL